MIFADGKDHHRNHHVLCDLFCFSCARVILLTVAAIGTSRFLAEESEKKTTSMRNSRAVLFLVSGGRFGWYRYFSNLRAYLVRCTLFSAAAVVAIIRFRLELRHGWDRGKRHLLTKYGVGEKSVQKMVVSSRQVVLVSFFNCHRGRLLLALPHRTAPDAE